MTLVLRRLGRDEIDHERLWLLVGLACVVLIALGGLDHLAARAWCPIKTLSGWPCAGCGTTRALVALSHGALGEAFRLNPLAAAAVVGWWCWAAQAAVVVLWQLPRWRVCWSSAERAWTRRALAVLVAASWLFLAWDGR